MNFLPFVSIFDFLLERNYFPNSWGCLIGYEFGLFLACWLSSCPGLAVANDEWYNKEPKEWKKVKGKKEHDEDRENEREDIGRHIQHIAFTDV